MRTSRGERPSVALVARVRRRQPERLLGELGRDRRCAAIGREPRAASSSTAATSASGDVRRQREVTGAQERIVDDRRNALVNARAAPLRGRWYSTDDSSGWVKRIVPFSRSITLAANAGSSASAATPARSRSDSEGVPRAEASASASRVAAGSPAILARTSSSSVSGTGSGCSGSTSAVERRGPARARRMDSRPTARGCGATSAAANGLPARSRRNRWSAPTLSGPTGRCSDAPCTERLLELRLLRALGQSPGEQQADRARHRAAAARTRARCDEDGSSHWTSSIAIRIGSAFAEELQRRRARRRASARRSTGSPDASSRSSATSSARRLGVGSAGSTSSRTPSKQIAEPDVGEAALRLGRPRRQAPAAPLARAPRRPRAQSVDFPIPASPSSTSVAGRRCAASRNSSRELSSSSLPTTSDAILLEQWSRDAQKASSTCRAGDVAPVSSQPHAFFRGHL